MVRKHLYVLLAALPWLLAGCGGGGGDGGGNNNGNNTAACTTVEKNEAVYELMTDAYYWYQHVPDVDPADYASPQALLQAIRYQPNDETFSYLTTVAEEDAFLNNAAYYGFGFSMVLTTENRLFLREVFEGSPAHEAGMDRGTEITAINGESVASLVTSGQLDAALGPNQQGYTVEFTFIPTGGNASNEVAMDVSKDEVFSTVVGEVNTDLMAGGERVGYIYFRSFVNPAFNQLDAAFAEMKNENITKLILDMRYNGGGLLSVAGHLGSLIAGNAHADTVVAEIEFNDRYTHLNEQYLIEQLVNSATIEELVVITTGATASASEMIINGLQPHMEVTVVGDNTYGKPVGQSRLEFCETDILRAVTFKVVNSEGDGEYFRPVGIPPTCPAYDDILNPFGDANEASVKEALTYLETGMCSDTASVKAAQQLARHKALRPDGDPLVRDGWDVLTGGVR